MDRSLRRIILKARQVGMSNVIAIEAVWDAIHKPNSKILFVSKDLRAAQNIIQYCYHTILSTTTIPKPEKSTQSEIGFSNGSLLVSMPATKSAGRSFSASSVYLDEFAFAEYADSIYQSIVGTLGKSGRLTVLSTPNGINNLFYRIWDGREGPVTDVNKISQESRGGIWSRHLVHWTECPRYTPEWGKNMQATMSARAWAEEYACSFESSGQPVFNPTDIDRASDGWEPNGRFKKYITAWDIGRRRDFTVGVTIATTDHDVWHLVKIERFGNKPYPFIQSKIEARAQMFPGEHYVESNGVGDPVIENLNIHVKPFATTSKSKIQALESLQLLFEKERIKFSKNENADSEELYNELRSYEWDDDNLTQDCVMALAIAASGVAKPRFKVRPL